MEPEAFCRAALAGLDDWVTEAADQAAVTVLLSNFIRTRPTEPLFMESLRALARNRDNGSLSRAAVAIWERWRLEKNRPARRDEPLPLRPEDHGTAPSREISSPKAGRSDSLPPRVRPR